MPNTVFNLPIILIGPMAAGKSSVASELAQITGLRRIAMDRVRWYYYFQDGFSIETESKFSSFEERTKYWKPFEAKAVKEVVKDFSDSIIDFGAGHSHFKDSAQFEMVRSALSEVKNIFLLVPSADTEESVKICNERLQARDGSDMDSTKLSCNREFVEHASSRLLSKQVVYTGNETPAQTARKIIKLLA